MRMSRVLLAGVAVAAAGIATSAFTNNNTFDPNATADAEVGYGELAVSGVTVSNVAYAPEADDATTLDTVTFTVTTDATDTNAYLTITGATDTLGGGPFTCTTPTTENANSIVCDVDTPVAIIDIKKVALTVVAR